MKTSFASVRRFRPGAAAGLAAMVALGGLAGASSPPPQVTISNVPLVLVQPTDPQVLVIIPNSQSMDGDLSGAIMTGSGTVAALTNSSSPVDYSVPQGYTAPISGDTYPSSAPYTVDISGRLYDNSASRLNVAKASFTSVLQNYAASFDFGLMTYKTSGIGYYTTWVYYMSAPGGFTFNDNNTDPLPSGANEWVANPCYNSSSAYCNSISGVLAGVESEPYMAVAQSSDDPDINDVLYAPSSYLSAVCIDYGTHHPSNPYTWYTLGDYNQIATNPFAITVSYNHSAPGCATTTGPTNAGFVPFSDQVMYAERGFGYYISGQSATSGNILIGVAPAGTGGNPPTSTQLQTYLNKFKPYLKPETSSTGTGEIKALALQSPVAGLIECADQYYNGTGSGTCGTGGSPPPSNDGCTPNKYVVLVTDGLPTEDLNQNAWPPLGTAAANGYGVHATFNLSTGGTVADTDPNFETDVQNGLTTTVASTNDQALTDTISKIAALTADGVQTYVVGMGAGVDPTKNPAAAATLKAMAIAGGTSDYFGGVSPQDVVNDLEVIFAQIEAANMTTTTVAVDSTSYQSGAAVYQAKFDTGTFHWSGNLVAYPFNSDGTVDTNPLDELWDARNWMSTQYANSGWDTNRLVTAWNPAINSGAGGGVPFRWSQLTAAEQADLENHWASLTAAQQTAICGGSTVCDQYGKDVLDYLRGDQSNTVSNGGPFRDRNYLLGDVVNSAPLYIGAPNGSYPGAGYANFVTNNAGRTPMLYLGSNDGAVHAFNANNGHEVFVFFPFGPFDKLADLTLPSYDSNHEFMVDGSPNGSDVRFSDGSWHTMLIGGLNDGGSGIYAIDITDPSVFTTEANVANSLMWDITSATPGFSHLGLTYSQPQIAQLNIGGTNTFVVIFGSGYNNDDGKPYLYIVNAETGVLIETIDLCAQDALNGDTDCNSSEANGLSTALVVSSTGTSVADRVYVGDLQGNLWRVDLSSSTPASWTAAVLLKARDLTSGIDQPITTQPVASFAPPGAGGGTMVFFGTGEFLGDPDITNTDTQSFYGVIDHGSAPSSPYTQSDLNQYTLTDTSVSGVNVRTISGSPMNWGSQKGWYMNLPESGERTVTDPRLLSGRVIFTTFTPDTTPCSAGGSSWLMVVNYAGGSFGAPEFDLNGDGQLNGSDQAGGQNPVGVALGAGYAAAPRLMRYQQGPFNDLKLVTISVTPVKSIKERGVAPGKLSWTEIR